MLKNKMVKEIFFLRFFACLAVVLLHVIDDFLVNFSVDSGTRETLETFNMFLFFGTPTFVFISEFVLAKVYNENIPKGFLFRRIKFIVVPYVVMALFYAALHASSQEDKVSAFSIKALKNIFLGDYHGYFVIVIFQFYVLHMIFHNYLKNLSPVKVIAVSFIVNIAYLSVFNFANPLDGVGSYYNYNKLTWLPFVGWIFYFTLAYYGGIFFSRFNEIINKLQTLIIIMPIITGSIVYLFYKFQIIETASSKRVDILLYTTSVIFILYLIGKKTKHLPKIIEVVSRYSFGIYLLHIFVITVIRKVILKVNIIPDFIIIPVLFFGSVLISIAATYLINKFKIGKFIIGQIGKPYNGTSRKFKKETEKIA